MARLGRHSDLGGDSYQWMTKNWPDCSDSLSGGEWVKLLTNSPKDLNRFKKSCNWQVIRGDDWVEALDRNPEMWKECPDFSALSGEDWITILKSHPEVKGDCCWDVVQSAHWIALLFDRPEFIDVCEWNWSCLTGDEWVELLRIRPDLANKMDLTADNLAAVVGEGMGHLCGIENIHDEELLLDLIRRNPKCFNYCDKKNLSAKAWGALYDMRDQFQVVS